LNRKLTHPTIFGSNSQVAIKALNNQCSHPDQHILNNILQLAKDLHKKQDNLRNHAERAEALAGDNNWQSRSRGIVNLQVHLVPGQLEFVPSNKVDEEAKKATQSGASDTKLLPKFLHKHLPLSISALHQDHLSKLKKHWEEGGRNLQE
jgi:hypothetical protein